MIIQYGREKEREKKTTRMGHTLIIKNRPNVFLKNFQRDKVLFKTNIVVADEMKIHAGGRAVE